MHGTGQAVFSTGTSIDKGAPDHPRRGRAVSMAPHRLQRETITHHRLPFRAMRQRPGSPLASLPENHQMGDFMRDGDSQIIFQVFCQQLQVNPQQRAGIPAKAGLSGAAPPQRQINGCRRQIEPITSTGALFRRTHGLLKPQRQAFQGMRDHRQVTFSGCRSHMPHYHGPRLNLAQKRPELNSREQGGLTILVTWLILAEQFKIPLSV